MNKLEEIKQLEARLNELKESLKPKKFKFTKEFIKIMEEDLTDSPQRLRIIIGQGTPIDYFRVMIGLYEGSISEGVIVTDDDGEDGVVFEHIFVPLDILEEVK